MMQASRLLAPRNDAAATGKIGVYSLAAGVATAAIDLLPVAIVPSANGRWWVTLICDQEFYVVLGAATVVAPVIATTGNLGAGGPDARCFGPLPRALDWHREIGPESQFLRAISPSASTLRVYVSSVGPFGELPG